MARVGIKDIAEKAGVSIATVSHAFRNPKRVSKATRERVLAAADEVGYTPNSLAVSLRTSRSGNIVVVIPDVTDSYNSEIILAIETIARGRGYSVLLGNTQGSEKREREFASMVQSRQADGIILMSHRIPFDMTRKGFSENDLPPMVSGSENTGCDLFPSVAIDDQRGGFDATNHLINLGHKDIAVITGDRDSSSTQSRLAGYLAAMEQAGHAVDDRWIIYSEYTSDSGELAAKEILMRKERPTAIFCFSDEIALGCIHTLQHEGFAVPDDISVVGFDDIPFSKYFTPALTTIAQPAEAIGRMCATLLLDLIDGKKPNKYRFTLPHTLIVRDSTRSIA